MMKVMEVSIMAVIFWPTYWWNDNISIVGNVNPANVQIGEDVILSCQAIGCGSPNLQVHLYKLEGSVNKTVYIHHSTKHPRVQGNNLGETDKNRTQKAFYMSGHLEVTLFKVKATDSGPYVCALKCGDVYKEKTMEIMLGGIINASVGEEVILPCPLIVPHDPSYLKMQWRKISLGKSQMIYSYLLQNTSPVTYSEDTHGDRCTSSNGPSNRVSFGNEYKKKAEVFKGNEFRNKDGYLKLKKIQKEDAGKYLCLVKSNLLHKHVTFQLSVKGFQDQDAVISMFCFSVLPYLLSSLLLEICFVKLTDQQQKEKEELQKLNCEGDYLYEETCQWQIDKEELQKLHREINNLYEEKYEWQKNKEEFQKLHKEVEWRRACSNADTITLDAESAHPNIFIAVDNKSFTYKAQQVSFSANPQRFNGIVSVLGSEGFSSGNHYWTVETGGSTEWDLGVARRSIQRKGQILLSPKEGFWVLGRSGKDYWAKTNPWTRVTVQRKLNKIGVYLNFQQKEVTFFSIVDMSVVFIFRDCAFSEEIFPFFKNADQETTVKICTIKEEEA